MAASKTPKSGISGQAGRRFVAEVGEKEGFTDLAGQHVTALRQMIIDAYGDRPLVELSPDLATERNINVRREELSRMLKAADRNPYGPEWHITEAIILLCKPEALEDFRGSFIAACHEIIRLGGSKSRAALEAITDARPDVPTASTIAVNEPVQALVAEDLHVEDINGAPATVDVLAVNIPDESDGTKEPASESLSPDDRKQLPDGGSLEVVEQPELQPRRRGPAEPISGLHAFCFVVIALILLGGVAGSVVYLLVPRSTAGPTALTAPTSTLPTTRTVSPTTTLPSTAVELPPTVMPSESAEPEGPPSTSNPPMTSPPPEYAGIRVRLVRGDYETNTPRPPGLEFVEVREVPDPRVQVRDTVAVGSDVLVDCRWFVDDGDPWSDQNRYWLRLINGLFIREFTTELWGSGNQRFIVRPCSGY